ncbi:uncharacterized protein DUF4352 [Krasilnikovia cinnamomea]|uniref:Uncharacterized protein DUF4352 n=2 Tax=Krasilnikovia cinnamomea TaxID=349313 RepID=A0A4Q7ZQH7_9ACTN|nr:uncharacterized protein DUF4352 [Krasilnikovia cinnamomea]
MEVDHDAGVMRCPYCRREVLIPASQAPETAWPFGADGAAVPHITINTTRTLTQSPQAIRRRQVAALIIVVATFVAVGAVLFPIFSSILFDSSDEVDEVAVGATAQVKQLDTSYEATVRGIDCTRKAITKPDDPATDYEDSRTEKAKGKFCVVSFSVKNVGEKTDTYPYFDLKATNPTERELDENTTAEDYLNNTSSNALSEPIDPGKTVDRLLVFDVPADTTLAYLQICDGRFGESGKKVKFDS